MGRPKKNPTSVVAPSKKIHSLEGLSDIITETDAVWELVLKRFQKISRTYGFARTEVPFIEDQQLYHAYSGGDSQWLASLVGLELSGKPAAVRPSLLPGVLRSYAQKKIYDLAPLSKWSFSGSTVRSNAKGIPNENYEFGFEIFGSFNHLTEAQVIGAAWELLLSLELTEAVLEINSIGNMECQSVYQDTLRDFLASKKYELCDNCNDLLQGRVLGVFRCTNIDCQAILSEAPTILDFLDQDSHKYFTSILEALDELSMPYQLNPLYVGQEGLGHTNFVIKCKSKGQMITVGEGGFHEEIMRSISGKPHRCFGFVGSLQAVAELVRSSEVVVEKQMKNDVFLVPLGELAAKKSLRLFRDLTAQQVSVYDHFGTVGVKNQLKQAELYKAPIALIMGQKEAVDEMVILRDVKSGMQEIISYDKIVIEVKKRLGR